MCITYSSVSVHVTECLTDLLNYFRLTMANANRIIDLIDSDDDECSSTSR